MKKDKNKIVWFLGLIVICFGILFIGNRINVVSLSGDINSVGKDDYNYGYDSDYNSDYNYNYPNSEYDYPVVDYDDRIGTYESNEDFPLGVALFMEAFVTIHMSVFVLIPLSKIFGKENHKKLFYILFILRVVLLLIGDFCVSTSVTAMSDFIGVFIGAFLVVPICASIKGVAINKKSNQVIEVRTSSFSGSSSSLNALNYKDIDVYELQKIGFSDAEILKRALTQHYIDINDAYNKWDSSKLQQLCSAGVYMNFKNEKLLYDKVCETKICEKFDFYDIKLINAEKHGSEIYVDIIVKYRCFEYILNQYKQIVRGSNSVFKNYSKMLSFSRKMSGNFVSDCPNCNAPINESNVEFCSYCGTALNYKIGDWVLKKEVIISER